MMGQFYFFITDMLYGIFIFLAFAPGMKKISHNGNGKDIAVLLKLWSLELFLLFTVS